MKLQWSIIIGKKGEMQKVREGVIQRDKRGKNGPWPWEAGEVYETPVINKMADFYCFWLMPFAAVIETERQSEVDGGER